MDIIAVMDRSRQTEMQRDWDVVSRWMLPGIIILVLLTVIDTVAYHTSERARRMHALEEHLPKDYDETVRALVLSSGHACENVCSLSPLGTFSDKMTLVATCGVQGTSGNCDQPSRFTLTITPSSLPSR